jgi:hypothetical protein
MRLFFILTLFWSFSTWAQLDTGSGGLGACTQATAGFQNGGTFECASLTLNGSPAFIAAATPLIIKVTGAVTISGNMNLNGAAGGTNLAFSGSAGGDGGPGANDGGGDDGGGTALPGTGGSLAVGGAAGVAGACGHGGGGAGGILLAGANGIDCIGGGNFGVGGQPFPATDFDINTLFRGGFGGGAGSDDGVNYGAGGGGGGAIHIIAGGNVSITVGGSLTANGGQGGSSNNGGGGGGGSGGAIWIQTLGNITIDGTISSDGGPGGTSVTGGAGGDGKHGVLRLEDMDGIISGSSVLPTYTEKISLLGNSSGSGRKLTSDISCGSISQNAKRFPLHLQMMMGFIFVFFGAELLRRLKIFS